MLPRLALLVLLASGVVHSGAHADCYIRAQIASTGIGGVGGTKGTVESWFSGKKQAESTELDFQSAVMRQFVSDKRTRSITDLDRRVVIFVDDNEKTYSETSLDALLEQLETARAEMQEQGYGDETASEPVPRAKEGEPPEITVEVTHHDEERTIAGMKAKRSTMLMKAVTVDEESGEEVTFKVIYDAWLTPDFAATAEVEEFQKAYAEAMGLALSSTDVDIASVFAGANLAMGDFADEASKLEGYPLATTTSFGTVLTEEQRKQMEEEEKRREEEEKKSSSGGFGGLGGLGKKIQKSVEDSIGDKLVSSMFGEGATFDDDGDPILFSTTHEVELVTTDPVEAERFVVPEGYTPAP